MQSLDNCQLENKIASISVSETSDNQEDDFIEPQPKRDNRKLIAVVIIVTLLAVWLVPSDEEPVDPVVATPETPGVEEKLPTEPNNPEITDASARDLISKLDTSKPADLDRAFIAAQRYKNNGQLEDAYLLYFYAARAGHGKAALTLAQQADPAHFEPGGLYPEADAGQAYKWYKKAAEIGEPQATRALQALRSTVEAAATNGDNRAQRLILQWK
jgi:hypothetical protein